MILNSPYITGSITVTGNANIQGELTVTGSLSGIASTASFALTLDGTGSVGFATTGAFAATSGSASSRLTQIEQVYATTGSNSFRATQSITGSLTVTGQIIAQTLNVQQVTSSIVFSSGSNTFGCDLNSRQTFTGSVLMTGSLVVNTTGPELQVNNNGVILGNLTADRHSVTGSFYQTGSVAIFNSNVGIVTTPNITVGTTELAIGSSNTNPLISGIRDGVSAFSLSSDSAGTKLFERRNSDLIFGSNNTERMRITSTGVVEMNACDATYIRFSYLGTSKGFIGVAGAVSDIISGAAAGDLTIRAQQKMQFSTGGDVPRMTITCIGNVGIGLTNPTGSLSIKAEVTNTPSIVFQNSSGGPNSAISNYTSAAQTFTVIGTNAYVNSAATLARFNTSFASSAISFDEGDIAFSTGCSGMTLTQRMRILSGGDVNIVGNNIRSLGGSYVLRDSGNTLTGGLFGPKRNWFGCGSDWGPIIAAETGYGIYTYTNGNVSPSGPYVAPGGTTWTNGSSDVRKKKNFETTQGLAEVLQIEPIKYHFNEDDDSSKKRLGFKAQNILPLIPEMVSETGELAEDASPYLTVTPDYILPVLVKAIQEQQCTINTLKTCLGIS